MHMIILIFKILLALALLVALAGALRTWQMEHSAQQTQFAAGGVPHPALDGFYHGKIGWKTTWLGKKFDAASHTGINLFDKGNGVQGESSAFVTYPARGLRDNLDVLAINYNIPANPWYMHPILDKLVQVSPDHYLGKLQLRLIPGFPFTLGFFELQK